MSCALSHHGHHALQHGQRRAEVGLPEEATLPAVLHDRVLVDVPEDKVQLAEAGGRGREEDSCSLPVQDRVQRQLPEAQDDVWEP